MTSEKEELKTHRKNSYLKIIFYRNQKKILEDSGNLSRIQEVTSEK